jgi:two-component system chemotaxis response regulator CheB
MSRIKVLVVDDSVVIRKLVTDLLASDPDLEVVGTAVNGLAAQTKVELLQPDLVTMDIEMPTMDGIEAVRKLRASGSTVPIIMFSTLTERGATATLDALAAGATDYVAKPANVGSVGQSMQQVRDALIPRIKALVPVHRTVTRRPDPVAAPVASPRRAGPIGLRSPAAGPRAGHRLLVIGSSTGGPAALTTLLGGLPPLSVPIAVVQHMPPVFTKQFATRLDRSLQVTVREVEHGDVLRPGTVSIAPGDYHLSVRLRGGDLVAQLSQAPPENYCRPAVDVLFRTAAEALGNKVLGVVLTGMGQDGCRGAKTLVDAGSSVLAQDEVTSVVWGMPGAVAQAGLAEAVLPLPDLAPEVVRRLVHHATPAHRHTAGAPR